MKCKGAAFLQRSTNSDGTFLRGLFAWSIYKPNINILGQDMINPKRTTQWSVGVLCNNAIFLTAQLALLLAGIRSQVEGSQF